MPMNRRTTVVSSNNDMFERREAAIPRGVGSACRIVIDRAENSELFDVEGRRYIDFAAGIAVMNVGHSHPKVREAVTAQLEKVAHACFQVTPYTPYIELAERLNAAAPGPSPKKTIFLTSGAEAVENAIKIARRHTGRSAVITFTGGYHGRTMFTLGMTGKVVPYKAGFGPMPGDIFHVPFPIDLHGVSVDASMHAIEQVFKGDVEASGVAAIVLEPILGEGGFYPAPPALMRRLRELCDQHGILLVADEIQTGFARTGKMFAMHHHDVEVDLMTVAKSLGGGLPISGVIGRAEIMDAPTAGGLGGTYGGNALSCAAGLAVLDIIEEEGLCDRAVAQGARIQAHMKKAAERLEVIGDVRGTGAMCAVELFQDASRKKPAPELAKKAQALALEEGLVVLSCGLHGNVLRVLAPLTISDPLLDEGLAILEHSIERAMGAI